MEQAGEVRFDFYYNGNKQTHADCLVISNTADLIRKRVDFHPNTVKGILYKSRLICAMGLIWFMIMKA